MVDAGTYGCFVLAGLFASPLQRKQNAASTISTVEAQLSLHKRKQPQKHRNGKKPAANYELQAKVRNCAGHNTLCPISELHDPVDSQSQLESISPLVGRPTTCIVTL